MEDYYWANPPAFLSSTPDEKNLSILTMFLRNPHCAWAFESTSAVLLDYASDLEATFDVTCDALFCFS